MIWFFKRGRERAVFEVRQGSGHFEMAVRRPDGTETITSFREPPGCLRKSS